MTDDPTRGDGLDGADVADDEDGEDERPVVVLNPALDRVTGRRVFGDRLRCSAARSLSAP